MYVLQALIGSGDSLRNCTGHLKSRRVIELGSGLSLLPVTDELRAEVSTPGARPQLLGCNELSAGVEHLVLQLSARSRVAYVEAEYFGGVGAQVAAVFESGQLILGPLFEKSATSKGPISRALEALGVQAAAGLDEFDTVGLGRHRITRDWASEASDVVD
jgi:hypothetical protein